MLLRSEEGRATGDSQVCSAELILLNYWITLMEQPGTVTTGFGVAPLFFSPNDWEYAWQEGLRLKDKVLEKKHERLVRITSLTRI